MFFSIRHVTRFAYSAPVSESNMEARMRPRSDGNQRCLKFELRVIPRSKVGSYRDHNGNMVSFFNVPAPHTKLLLVAESLVETAEPAALPDSLPMSSWDDVDRVFEGSEHWDFQMPSTFAAPTALLRELEGELRLTRRDDPLNLLRELNRALFRTFEYAPKTTRADSPIDVCLESRKGVCQDYTHVMITLVRGLKIPCRYVSGYLFPRTKTEERSALGATHAWLEAFLPGLGWVGFDPTNNELCNARHIRTAIGRDYADVPPTKGVFKGRASSELSVAVRVNPTDAPNDEKDDFIQIGAALTETQVVEDATWEVQRQQQQQQQQ